MTLIEQLRNIGHQTSGPYKNLTDLCGEAADEIERLLAVCKGKTELLTDTYAKLAQRERDQL